MTTPTREIRHATAVAMAGRAALITGPSGAGKSDLALRVIMTPYSVNAMAVEPVTLVADDQVVIERRGGRLYASPPPSLAGKLEVRGQGIVSIPHTSEAEICLILALQQASTIERMPPEGEHREILGVTVPLLRIDPSAASAPARLVLAMSVRASN